ncbi:MULTISPECIES: alpha/beta hydrolase [Sinorhizobium]|uniref:alpha/beta hydrolase n=1 Tax=Sinorhizobium TaxID=28105 RepID=UPI000BE9CECF|nr:MULTISPECIES: alpha/beta hydrolase [Sinorhizobium]PDT55026.1 alpha/beta hydrolase [Sinorhizobium sp. NG07B]POH32068.1 hypothetical protein ATY30_11750 [Sinorhizobium americanum]
MLNKLETARIDLVDTGCLVAQYQPAERSDLLVVSFHSITRHKLLWGADFFRKRGISVIGITDYKKAWYCRREMDKVLSQILPLLKRYDRVITYGHSMGAYAALKYGSALGAEIGLAFSPQHSIELKDVWQFDRARSELYYREPIHKGMKVEEGDLPMETFVFVDWFTRIDRRHAARLPKTPNLHIVRCPFLGHSTINTLAEAGNTGLLFDLIRENNYDARTFRHLVRASRRFSDNYWQNFDEAAERRSQRHPTDR